MSRRPRLGHRVEYLVLRAVIGGLSLLPARVADPVASVLAHFVFSVLRVRRGVVESQIAAAYSEMPRAEVRRMARACYVHFAREMVAIAAFVRTWPDGLRRCVEYRGIEGLREAAAGGGALIVTGHFGNWELAAPAVAAVGIEMHAVVQPQANPRVDAWVARTRESLGLKLVRRGRVAHAARRILRRNAVLGIAADQDARGRGVFVPFFGRPASTHRGPALLALALRRPLFIGVLRRIGPGRRYRLEIEPVAGAPELAAARHARGAGGDDPVLALTARWVAHLERLIRVSPEQYFWHHRRWKTGPPGTPGAGPGTNAEPGVPRTESRSA